MPRPRNRDRPIRTNINIPESVRDRVDFVLFNIVRRTQTKGALSNLISTQLEEWADREIAAMTGDRPMNDVVLPDVEAMNEAERLAFITQIRAKCQSQDATDDEIKAAILAVRIQRTGAASAGKKAEKPPQKKLSMAELLSKPQ